MKMQSTRFFVDCGTSKGGMIRYRKTFITRHVRSSLQALILLHLASSGFNNDVQGQELGRYRGCGGAGNEDLLLPHDSTACKKFIRA